MASIAARIESADTARRMSATEAGSTDDSDETLMLAYARGDAIAFERLYRRHKGPTYRYLLRHTAQPAVADELHQDVWLKVVRVRERYARDARFTTWLYTLARNRLIDHWRSQRGLHVTSLEDEAISERMLDELAAETGGGGNDPLALTINMQLAQRLQAAVAGLPGAQRDAFLLHVEAGLALDEIARVAAAPVETIKSRLRYAYGKLRGALEDLR